MYVDLNQNSKKDLLRLKTLTDRQGDTFKWFYFYQLANERLNKILAITSLDLYAYTLINSSNKKVKLPTLTDNKYYLLDFWFLACKPCISDHKEIFKNQQLLAAKKIELISISIDESVKELNNYLNKNSYKWINYLETDPKKITTDAGINIFPTYLILDKSGKIISSQNTFDNVLKWLESND
jgi:thiol-disulfide isomerase/thioredoxin